MKGPHGYIHGYNGIAIADSGNQVIVAAEVIGSGAESGCLPRMLDSLEINMQKATEKKQPIKNLLSLAIQDIFLRRIYRKQRNTEVLILQHDYEENLSEKNREKIDNRACREIYSRRMQIIEPVFANMTYCKGMAQFTLRTQKKENIQWLLFTIVHNMWKCMKPLGLQNGI